MKKSISIVLSILAILVFVFFAVASGDSDSDTSKSTQSAGEVASESADDSSLGDYQVEIKNARLTKNYEGKDAVVITYGFTNNADEPAAFWLAFEDSVFQGGVGLEKAYVLKDGDPYDEANQNKEIKSGVSIDVDVAYILNDTETDIEVEVKELISFSDEVVSRVFSIKK